jgi:hypothetical protein
MVADYTEMKNVLQQLQDSVTEQNAVMYAMQISTIKEQVQLLEANYKRLSYIMFLLNMPNNKKKEKSYIRREHKKLYNIPIEHRQESIEEENSDILNNIKSIKE